MSIFIFFHFTDLQCYLRASIVLNLWRKQSHRDKHMYVGLRHPCGYHFPTHIVLSHTYNFKPHNPIITNLCNFLLMLSPLVYIKLYIYIYMHVCMYVHHMYFPLLLLFSTKKKKKVLFGHLPFSQIKAIHHPQTFSSTCNFNFYNS